MSMNRCHWLCPIGYIFYNVVLLTLVHACVHFVIVFFCQLKGTTAQAITAAAHTCVCHGQVASPAAVLAPGTPRASRGAVTSEST